MTRDLLFDRVLRTDATPGRHGESRYQFLNRSASSYFGNVREVIEDWLAEVPSQERRDLVGALKGDNRQHEAAFWELYLHEGYRRSGYSIMIHPALASTTTRPDFLLEKDDDRFYVEAVSVGRPPTEIAEDRRLQEVHRVLSALKVENFSIDMEHYGVGARPLSTSRLRSELVSWLRSLDPDQVTRRVEQSAARFDSLPELVWEDDGWSLVFRAFPLREAARGQARSALGMMGPGEATMVDNFSGLRRVLEHKNGRYGVLDAPLVIAVQSNTDYPTHDHAAEHALFGLASRRPSDPDVLNSHFVEDGFWLTPAGWRRSDCPQVVTVYGLAPWSITQTEPRV